jgi:hypothetical protein
MRTGEECRAETFEIYPYLRWSGYYIRRRHGTLRKVASCGSNFLYHLTRPESRSALHRTNGIHILSFQQIAGRAASTAGVDAGLRRVLCRASILSLAINPDMHPPGSRAVKLTEKYFLPCAENKAAFFNQKSGKWENLSKGTP